MTQHLGVDISASLWDDNLSRRDISVPVFDYVATHAVPAVWLETILLGVSCRTLLPQRYRSYSHQGVLTMAVVLFSYVTL